MKNTQEKLFHSFNQIILRIKLKEIIFEEATQFIVKYDAAITIEALNIEIENRTDLTEDRNKRSKRNYKNI